jgi:pilus assembly protein Flp/PilA
VGLYGHAGQAVTMMVVFADSVAVEVVVKALLSSVWHDQSGATAIEYALIAGSIGLVIIAAAQAIGVSLVTVFTNVSTGFPT